MSKAWKRQFGADTIVEIDIEKQIAYLRIAQPTPIRIEEIERSTRSAGHTLRQLHIDVQGRSVNTLCSLCEIERPFLQLEPTGQQFEISGILDQEPSPKPLRFQGTVTRHGDQHQQIELGPAAFD